MPIARHRTPRRMDTAGVFSLLVDQDVWQVSAACVVPEDAPAAAREAMWSAMDEPAASAERLAMLRALCSSCPVVAECREHAEVGRLAYGFFGGLTAEERRARRRGDGRSHEALAAQGWRVGGGRHGVRGAGGHGGDRRSVGYVVSAAAPAGGGAAEADGYEAEVSACVRRIESLGVRLGAGRAECRDALRRAGWSVPMPVVVAALDARRRERRHLSVRRSELTAPRAASAAEVRRTGRRPLVLVRDGDAPTRWQRVAAAFGALGSSTETTARCCEVPARPCGLVGYRRPLLRAH